MVPRILRPLVLPFLCLEGGFMKDFKDLDKRNVNLVEKDIRDYWDKIDILKEVLTLEIKKIILFFMMDQQLLMVCQDCIIW